MWLQVPFRTEVVNFTKERRQPVSHSLTAVSFPGKQGILQKWIHEIMDMAFKVRLHLTLDLWEYKIMLSSRAIENFSFLELVNNDRLPSVALMSKK